MSGNEKYASDVKNLDMGRIKTIPYLEATGRLKEIYDELIKSRGKLAEIHTIQSLRPESIKKHIDLYMEIMYSRSELSRAERELIGTTVSIANQCKYCTLHHSQALGYYWRDEQKIEKLLKGEFQNFTEKEKLLIEISVHLTKNPEIFEHDAEIIQKLKNFSFNDAAILDIVLTISYFNFVNRIALALGLQIDEEETKGYKY
ncbi:MAG: peroxidase-related enzyme [Raineya sp.]